MFEDNQETIEKFRKSVSDEIEENTTLNSSDLVVELTCRLCVFECETKDEIEAHMKIKHQQTQQNEPEVFKFACHLCDYETNDTKDVDAHGILVHGILACDKCEYQAEDRDLMRRHMETHTGRNILPCGICEFESTKKATLNEHVKSKHNPKKSFDNKVYDCRKCKKQYIRMFIFNNHKCCPQLTCDYDDCEFVGKDVSNMVSHINKHHRRSVYHCQHCDYEAEERTKLNEHLT